MQQLYSPYQQYQKSKQHEVLTASPVKLVGMLLEGAILFNKKALISLEENHVVAALEFVDRSSKIIMHLYNSLDFEKGGDIASKFGSLYSYILDQSCDFIKSNRKPETLTTVNGVLATILEGWRKLEAQQNSDAGPASREGLDRATSA